LLTLKFEPARHWQRTLQQFVRLSRRRTHQTGAATNPAQKKRSCCRIPSHISVSPRKHSCPEGSSEVRVLICRALQ
jgi:hypothetical protein